MSGVDGLTVEGSQWTKFQMFGERRDVEGSQGKVCRIFGWGWVERWVHGRFTINGMPNVRRTKYMYMLLTDFTEFRKNERNGLASINMGILWFETLSYKYRLTVNC